VGVVAKLEKQIIESGVEVRLYAVIYDLTTDIENICRRLKPGIFYEKAGSASI
jgi:hypothetical protein